MHRRGRLTVAKSGLFTLPALLLAAGLLVFPGLSAAQMPSDSTASAPDSATTIAPQTEQSRVDSILTSRTVLAKHMVHGVPVSRNPTGACLRSIVVPGWGQLYTGHPLWGVVFFGADFSMIYGAVVQNNRYHQNLTYASETKSDTRRKQYERLADFYRDDRNKLIWWTSGTMLLAGFHAFVEAHLYDFRIDPNLGTTADGTGPQAGLTFTW